MAVIKFMYNGIKIDGKLIKGFWSKANYTNGAKYCFYADSYCSKELREHFTVKNDTDIMTDYFETDSIYFYEENSEIEKVIKQNEIKTAKRAIKRLEKEMTERPWYFEQYHKEDYNRYKEMITNA